MDPFSPTMMLEKAQIADVDHKDFKFGANEYAEPAVVLKIAVPLDQVEADVLRLIKLKHNGALLDMGIRYFQGADKDDKKDKDTGPDGTLKIKFDDGTKASDLTGDDAEAAALGQDLGPCQAIKSSEKDPETGEILTTELCTEPAVTRREPHWCLGCATNYTYDHPETAPDGGELASWLPPPMPAAPPTPCENEFESPPANDEESPAWQICGADAVTTVPPFFCRGCVKLWHDQHPGEYPSSEWETAYEIAGPEGDPWALPVPAAAVAAVDALKPGDAEAGIVMGGNFNVSTGNSGSTMSGHASEHEAEPEPNGDDQGDEGEAPEPAAKPKRTRKPKAEAVEA